MTNKTDTRLNKDEKKGRKKGRMEKVSEGIDAEEGNCIERGGVSVGKCRTRLLDASILLSDDAMLHKTL